MSLVALLNADDFDIDDSLTFSLVAGEGDVDNHLFVVDDDQLLMIGSADFESQSSFSVRLQAADRGGLFVVDSFQLNVEDINDSPSSITASTLFINADAPARSTVADITTNDQDSNDRHVLTLIDGSMDNHLFSLSGRRLKLMPNVDISDQAVSYTHLTLPTICSV